MFKNKTFIGLVFLLLAAVVAYDFYYFLYAKKETVEVRDNARAPDPKLRSLPRESSALPRVGPAGRPVRQRAGDSTAAGQVMSFDEILDKIMRRNLPVEGVEAPLDPFRAMPDAAREHEASAQAGVSTQALAAKKFELTAIIAGEFVRSAILNGRVVTEGESLDGAVVKTISMESVELEMDGQTRVIALLEQRSG